MSRREYLIARLRHADGEFLKAAAAKNPVAIGYWNEIAEGWAIWIRHFDRRGWR